MQDYTSNLDSVATKEQIQGVEQKQLASLINLVFL